MNRPGYGDDVNGTEGSQADPITRMSTWAGRQGELREDSSIVALGLSARVNFALERGGVRTLAELAEVTAEDLMNFEGFDEDALVELEDRLNDFKLRIASPGETRRDQLFWSPRSAEDNELERVEQQSTIRPPGYEPH